MILALKAIQSNKKLSLRAAAKLYNVLEITLRHRRNGIPTRRDSLANLKKLTQSKEEAIVKYILDLVKRTFPPRLYSIEDIANQLLHVHDKPPIGKL